MPNIKKTIMPKKILLRISIALFAISLLCLAAPSYINSVDYKPPEIISWYAPFYKKHAAHAYYVIGEILIIAAAATMVVYV